MCKAIKTLTKATRVTATHSSGVCCPLVPSESEKQSTSQTFVDHMSLWTIGACLNSCQSQPATEKSLSFLHPLENILTFRR